MEKTSVKAAATRSANSTTKALQSQSAKSDLGIDKEEFKDMAIFQVTLMLQSRFHIALVSKIHQIVSLKRTS